jgi:aspartate aminotransferase-like enzyme
MTNYAEKLFLELLRQKELGFIDFEKNTVIEKHTHEITLSVDTVHTFYSVKLIVDTWENPFSHYRYTTTDNRFNALHSYLELIKNFNRISKINRDA